MSQAEADSHDWGWLDRRGFVPRNRYRPSQRDGVSAWRTYGETGDAWFGFDSVPDLEGLPPEILLVPLPGHTWGHAGVAIRTSDQWLLHAGDGYFYRGEMREVERHCTPRPRVYQRMMEVDSRARLDNQVRPRRLSMERRDEVGVICAHDATESHRRQAGRPL